MKIIGDTKRNGTRIAFFPDPEIFETTRDFKAELLGKRLRELAFLNPGIHITFVDERINKTHYFHLQGWHLRIRQVPEREQKRRSRRADQLSR